MKRTVLAVVVLALLTQGALASIYSEDFSTDPFASRWTKTSTAGYGLYWAGPGWDPASFGGPATGLPTPYVNALYSFSTGVKQAWTTDVVEQASSYSVAMDFIISGDLSISDNSIGQYVQRQADNSAYSAHFSIGGNGQSAFGGVYGWDGYKGTPLVANEWYQLITDVAINPGDVQVQSRIVRMNDSVVMNTSSLFTDSTAGRLASAKGYGIRLSLPGTHYWNQALQIDNFEVVPEPATLVLLAAGGLLLRKRRA